MTTLNLSPLPCSRLDPTEAPRLGDMDGFVDDSVILSLLKGPIAHRDQPCAGDLALAADEMDFAGWSLGSHLPARATETPTRRATPPVLDESGIGQPHAGAHRWWLAGVAGAFSTMLVSLLLFSLSSRNTREKEDFSVIKAPKKEQQATEIYGNSRDLNPELTGTPAQR